jgi:nucleoside-diphosphate-sugar epimerase
MQNNIIAVTGASGFVGYALCNRMRLYGLEVRSIVRSQLLNMDSISVGDIGSDTDWSRALTGVNCLIHCAARVHVMHDSETESLAAFRKVNVEGTKNLAEQAVNHGVRRLVFLSSVKVNGEVTLPGIPFTSADPERPSSAYAISKWEAEQILRQIERRTGLEVVVVRSPLVYGAGVKANFKRLMRLVNTGIPLPFGKVDNHRSLVGIDNLTDLLIRCTAHPAAIGKTYMVSDGEDVSLTELIRLLSVAKGRRPCLFSVPPWVLRLSGWLCGYLPELERLLGNLQVNIEHTCNTLDWKPPFSLYEGLKRI